MRKHYIIEAIEECERLNRALNEARLIQIDDKPHVIFVLGGPASGKDFVIDKVLEHNGYVVSIDNIAKTLANNELKELEINRSNLSEEEYKAAKKVIYDKYHDEASAKYEPWGINRKLGSFANVAKFSVGSDNLANIVVNITGRNIKTIAKIAKMLIKAGYNPRNVDVIWVVRPIADALRANSKRDRVVGNDYVIDAHNAARDTLNNILNNRNLRVPLYKNDKKGIRVGQMLDGDITIVFNEMGKDSDVRKNSKGDITYVKDIRMMKIKESGKPIKSSSDVNTFLNELEKTVKMK